MLNEQLLQQVREGKAIHVMAYGLKTKVWTYKEGSGYGFGCAECCHGDCDCDIDERCTVRGGRKNCQHCKGLGWIPATEATPIPLDRFFEGEEYPIDYKAVPLRNRQGSATFEGKPSQEQIDAANRLSDLAYSKLEKLPPRFAKELAEHNEKRKDEPKSWKDISIEDLPAPDHVPDTGNMIEGDLPRPIGEFILAQKDIIPVQTHNGAYYHYSQVCILLNRKQATP